MSHFNLENDLNSVLHFDSLSMRGPVARWERKARETPSANHSLNVSSLDNSSILGTSINKTSKTPSKAPRLSNKDEKSLTPGRNRTPKTPNADCSSTADRFIPNRSAMQLEINHHMVTRGSNDDEENISPNTRRYREAMNDNLNGDLSNRRIIAYQNKVPNDQSGQVNALKVLYSSSKNPGSSKKTSRYIPQTPERILDAPEIIDDYYLNLLDWSSTNVLAVALSAELYLWDANRGSISHLTELEENGEYLSSVAWLPESGHCLAIGTSLATVELWDVNAAKRIRVMKSHNSRIPSLSWNSHILTSGAKDGSIHHHDVRIAAHHISSSNGHTQEVCGLSWSPDRRFLASGGNDNLLNIWQQGITDQPVFTFSDHQAAVKALSWCPWQPSILASGGGTADRHIRFWNCNLGTCLNAINTKSQVCAVLWSEEYKEVISGHGFANNEVIIWKYPQMSKVAELTGHTARVLSLTMSPDGTNVISAGADETLRLWNCFATDPKKKNVTSFNKDKNFTMRSIR